MALKDFPDFSIARIFGLKLSIFCPRFPGVFGAGLDFFAGVFAGAADFFGCGFFGAGCFPAPIVAPIAAIPFTGVAIHFSPFVDDSFLSSVIAPELFIASPPSLGLSGLSLTGIPATLRLAGWLFTSWPALQPNNRISIIVLGL
jgi:hypothetical protein